MHHSAPTKRSILKEILATVLVITLVTVGPLSCASEPTAEVTLTEADTEALTGVEELLIVIFIAGFIAISVVAVSQGQPAVELPPSLINFLDEAWQEFGMAGPALGAQLETAYHNGVDSLATYFQEHEAMLLSLVLPVELQVSLTVAFATAIYTTAEITGIPPDALVQAVYEQVLAFNLSSPLKGLAQVLLLASALIPKGRQCMATGMCRLPGLLGGHNEYVHGYGFTADHADWSARINCEVIQGGTFSVGTNTCRATN